MKEIEQTAEEDSNIILDFTQENDDFVEFEIFRIESEDESEES